MPNMRLMEWSGDVFSASFDVARGNRTQLEIAKAAGIKSMVISRWRGGRPPYLPTLQKVADALGVTPAFLLFGITRDMNDEELELINIFRRLPAAKRKAVIDNTKALAGK